MNHFLLQPSHRFLKLKEFTQKLIKKCCSGDRVIDLLFHFPVSIQNRSGNIYDFSDKDKLTVVIRITDHKAPHHRASPYKVTGQTADGNIITIVYFNYHAAFIRKSLPLDGIFMVSGNAHRTTEGIQITHPDVIAPPSMLKYYIGAEPVYPLVARLTNRTLQYAINSLLKIMPEIPDWIPEEFINKYELATFTKAIKTIHSPKTSADILASNPARKRIAIDELLTSQIRLRQIRESMSKQQTVPFFPTNAIIQHLHLPFELTDDQLSCLEDIKRDFASPKPMNRLIQGDVGAGKTVVSFISMLIALENNSQATLLAPTEILAIQHFNTIKKMAENLKLNIDIMLSSNRKFRSQQIERLKKGETQILIGTHAILEHGIEFKNLGLIVIDEQHRFGVLQRLTLIKKCRYPNILTMSATPIPRTLLLGCYGDLDVSTMKCKPHGRKPIETVVISSSKIDNLIQKLKTINSKIYWVCPVIEESEDLMDINTRSEYLNKNFSPKDVFILHGKMKSKEKDNIINRFKNGEFKVLVSTTVIEVGVDIHDANVIVIEHAERFGLAQLHQLRGRVGRGNEASYCVLLYHYPLSTIGKQRLQLMKSTNDGFLLSEEDLKLRGAGDILGKEQSGFNALRFSDFSHNHRLIQMAEEISHDIELNSESVKFLCEIFSKLNDDVVA
ncbi:MAG: ATP-dependent DNA helicase RecG [Holosporaceae bacterium]|jgi:ATP-dependent DNA helicase RecG|nr:ATP-dependent DNA helicase RecG [Holosporaceae bacterium]